MSEYTNAALDHAEGVASLHAAYRQVQERQRLKLAAAEVFDRALAMKRGELKRFGKSGRLNRQISVTAVMNAVNTEGREVLKADAEGYWKDQDRRYFGITEGTSSVTAMKNRLGKVTYRKVYGRDGVREYGTLLRQGGTWGKIKNKNITIMVI